MISEKDISIIKKELEYYLKNDKNLIEELLNTSLIKISRYNYHKKKNDKYYNALLIKVARSVLFDYKRKEKFSKIILKEIDDISTYNADYKIIKSEEKKLAEAVINFLSDRQREVVLMRVYLGLTYKEISEILNCSINTALGIMIHSKKKIRKHFLMA